MLIPPDQGPAIEGLSVPYDVYWVLRTPAPLAGMRLPTSGWPWEALHAHGFVHLVSLASCKQDPAPLKKVFDERLQDLFGGRPPSDPEREIRRIREAVRVINRSIQDGQGVVVHCHGGRGRTGTVLGCVLRERGLDGETVIAYLDRLHRARDRDGWPESPWQGDVVRRWPGVGPGRQARSNPWWGWIRFPGHAGTFRRKPTPAPEPGGRRQGRATSCGGSLRALRFIPETKAVARRQKAK